MVTAFRSGVFFLVFFISSAFSLAAQEGNIASQTLPRFSQASIEIIPLPNFQAAKSRIINFTEQSMSQSATSDQGSQLVLNSNIESYQGTIGVGQFPNTTFTGKTVRLSGFASGSYQIVMSLDGYDTLTIPLRIRDGMQYVLDVELNPRQGVIDPEGDHEIQVLEIDGDRVEGAGQCIVNEGQHLVRIRSFGFEDYYQSVFVYQGTMTKISVTFVPAQFRLSQAFSSRQSFRPANFGTLGTSTISFEVSSYGSGTLIIKDKSDITVRTEHFDRFVSWYQKFTWDGTDDTGKDLDEGPYHWEISATPSTGVAGAAQSASGTISIDNSSYIKFRSSWSGPSGLDLVSDVYTVAPGAFQTSAYFGGAAIGNMDSPSSWASALMNFRYGFVKNFEAWVGAGAGFQLSGNSQQMIVVGGGANWSFLPLPGKSQNAQDSSTDFGMALNVSAAGLVTSRLDGPFNLDAVGLLPGARLGVASQLRAGRFSFLLEPVAHILAWPVRLVADPSSTGPESLSNPSINFAGSLHGGIYLDEENMLVGVSSALWVTPQNGIELPVRLALNVQFMPAESFVIGIYAHVELGYGNNSEPGVGLTVGLIQ